jgi:hypothetical protein
LATLPDVSFKVDSRRAFRVVCSWLESFDDTSIIAMQVQSQASTIHPQMLNFVRKKTIALRQE